MASIVKYAAQLLPLLLIIWEYRLKYVDKDGRTIEHKRARTIVLILAICICLLGCISTLLDDHSKTKEKQGLAQSNTNLNRELAAIKIAQLNLPKEVSHGVNELLILATNVSISDAALKIEIREREAKMSQVIPISTDNPNFSALVTNYEERIRLTQLKKEKERREMERAAKIAADKVAQSDEFQENYVSEKTSPVFDYAIRTLHTFFAHSVRLAGEKNLTSTYAGLTRVMDSQFEKIDQLRSESKFPWVCEIFRTKHPRILRIKYADYNWTNWSESDFRSSYPGQDIRNIRFLRSRWENAALDPELTPGSGTNYVITLTIEFEGEKLDTISTSVTVRSKISETFPQSENRQPYTNYIESINSALGIFFGAQGAVVARSIKSQ